MKNGRALKGHCRIESSRGDSKGRNQGFTLGWDVGCKCGWSGGNHINISLARTLYRKHIDDLIDNGKFTCKRCGTEKTVKEMRPDYRYLCLACFSKLGNDWQRRNPALSARHKRNCHLIKKFGITLEESDRILAMQGGVCAICHIPFSDPRGYSPHVDHDHSTGKVRGLLCVLCNGGLGGFKDNIDGLYSAIEYLKIHGGLNK